MTTILIIVELGVPIMVPDLQQEPICMEQEVLLIPEEQIQDGLRIRGIEVYNKGYEAQHQEVPDRVPDIVQVPDPGAVVMENNMFNILT